MARLQTLLAGFIIAPQSHSQKHEQVFQHPMTRARVAIARGAHLTKELSAFGWVPADGSAQERSFNVLSAIQIAFPHVKSLHPDQLASVFTQANLQHLFAAQPVEQRGRLARWLLGRSQSTGHPDLARWTRDACSELPMKADHPLAPTASTPTFLASDQMVARITGNELEGYSLLQVDRATKRTMLTTAATVDELWTPDNEWTPAQWAAYEQLLKAAPATEQTFAEHVTPEMVAASGLSQHSLVKKLGTEAYLGTATTDLRRRFRHSPSPQWLDAASSETGINQRSPLGMNLLIDLWMVENLDDTSITEHIVPAMQAADAEFAEMSVDDLKSVWRNAYNPILNYSRGAMAFEPVKLRSTPAAVRQTSTAQSMRTLLGGYYGESAIETLERSGKLKLVDSVSDLPRDLIDNIELVEGETLVSGMYVGGTVYMIGANTKPENVCGTFLHEVGEHAALHQMLGADYGRIVARFNQLLSEGDTYALQASMKVPTSTHPANLSSEHLAYLVQQVADDNDARDGGAGGHELGQRCIRDLRTWLFRTPLMRELERQGEIEHFKIEPQDIAALAREAVDYYVAGTATSSVDHNQWQERLDSAFLGTLHGSLTPERTEALMGLEPDQQMAYLYALASFDAPDIHATLLEMAPIVADAIRSDDVTTRAIAGEINALSLRLSNRGRAAAGLEREGFFAAVSGADDPESSVLTIVRATDTGKWEAEHYQRGIGLTLREDFTSKADALRTISHQHFPVRPSELSNVIDKWGEVIAAEHGHLDSKSFQRWFSGSATRHADGTPMIMYHGTVGDAIEPDGMFWASVTAADAPTPVKASVPEYVTPKQISATDFKTWFGQSKIADSKGQPLEVFTTGQGDLHDYQPGAIFTSRAPEADTGFPVFLCITNPVIVPDETIALAAKDPSIRDQISRMGHDGVMSEDMSKIVPFNRGQIKAVPVLTSSRADVRFEASSRVPTTSLPAFKSWFGESTVVDQSGAPKIVYHGTHAEFTVFKPQEGSKFGFHFGSGQAASERLRDTAAKTFDDEEYKRLYDVATAYWMDMHAYRESLERKSSEPSTEELLAAAEEQGKEIWEVMADFAYRPTEEELQEYERLSARYEQANVIAHKYGAGSRVDAFYLALEHPLRLDGVRDWGNLSEIKQMLPWVSSAADFEQLSTELIDNGFDGVVYNDPTLPGPKVDNYIAIDPKQIKSAYGNVGNFSKLSKDVRFATAEGNGNISLAESKAVDADGNANPQYSFAGARADTSNRESLTDARKQLEQGVDADLIRQRTGWFEGADGRWRFEVDDSLMTAKQNWSLLNQLASAQDHRLQDLVDHSKLFDAYPFLRYLKVKIDPGLAAGTGTFRPYENALSIFAEGDEERINLSEGQLSALLKEVQHAIQEIETFSQGGLPSNEGILAAQALIENVNKEYDHKKKRAIEGEEYSAFLHAKLAETPESERMRPGHRGMHDQGLKLATEAAHERFVAPLERERLATIKKLVALKGDLETLDSHKLGYRLLAGEVEARNVQSRMFLSATERREVSPLTTQDAPQDTVFLWQKDEIQLAASIRDQDTTVPELSPTTGKVRLTYTDTSFKAGLDALADLFTQDLEAALSIRAREEIVDQLVDQLETHEAFNGLILPTEDGYCSITKVTNSASEWKVTSLNGDFSPRNSGLEQSKRAALSDFFGKFDASSAWAVISGGTDEINLAEALRNGVSPSNKGTSLADSEAKIAATEASALGEQSGAVVMPVYLSAKAPFDADKISKGPIRITQLRDELVKQAEAAGRRVDIMKVGSLAKTILLSGRSQETGPLYNLQDFWQSAASAFGKAGSAAIRQLFAQCGFDSVKMTQKGHLTYGVFDASQVKSAIGNTGLYTASADIRFAFAGEQAANSNLSRLDVAKKLTDQKVAPEKIWKETGWMVGPDGKWRFELDDSKARFRGYDYETGTPEITTSYPDRFIDWADESMQTAKGVPLGMILDHPALFEAYPRLANIHVVAFEPQPGDTALGHFAFYPENFDRSQIFIARPLTFEPSKLMGIFSHELQHGIQFLEGFAPGAVEDNFGSEHTEPEPHLKALMADYIDLHDHAAAIGVDPVTVADLSGYSDQIRERVKAWVDQGTWEENVASIKRRLMSPFDLYFHEAGEVEARNTQNRQTFSAAERESSFPMTTLDVEAGLVRMTRRVYGQASSVETNTGLSKADRALEWAIKTHEWRTALADSATLIEAGESINLFKVDSRSGSNLTEIYAVTLDGSVVGSFLYGQDADHDETGKISVAAMVAPEFRRQGIATRAYNAIERYSGQTLEPSKRNRTDASAAFWQSRALGAKNNLSPRAELMQWLRKSNSIDADGQPLVFYHGSMSAFRTFDAARHRSLLNHQYQGDVFHFSTSPDVAGSYATAAKNQLFRQHDLFSASDKSLPSELSELLKSLVLKGPSAWSAISPEAFREFRDYGLRRGFTLDELQDIAEFVEGSACAPRNEGLRVFGESSPREMPAYIRDLAATMGLTDAVPTPIVMPVYLRCENTLYTDDRDQAREAEKNGYDSVCYSGPDTVDGHPEWIVFDTKNVRSVFEFDTNAKVMLSQPIDFQDKNLGSPITPPSDTQFDRWLEGSHCTNQFGEPRLVFAKDNPGQPYSCFSDLDVATYDVNGLVTPAYLAIRSPFVVADSSTIAVTDLNQKLGTRKGAMVVAELMRDGQVHIEDVVSNPRFSKWIEQAGYDGAIFRDRSGRNSYVIYNDSQALLSSPVRSELTGPVIWGPIPDRPAPSFIGERTRAQQFTLSNQAKPHGHVVPFNAADQYLASSDRLFVNHLDGIRLTSVSISKLCEDPNTSTNLRDFLSRNKKALIGQQRIEDVFTTHIRTLREEINNARHEGRSGGIHANLHKHMEDKLSNSLGWAVDVSSRAKSYRGLIADDLLKWNAPLQDQSEVVRRALATIGIDGLYQVERNGEALFKTCNRFTADECAKEYDRGQVRKLDSSRVTGRACYEELANDLGSGKRASELLSALGIAGAQQASSEVLLFQPDFNHASLPVLKWSAGNHSSALTSGLRMPDLGGVSIASGIHSACKSIVANQSRALEMTKSAINLLSTRQAHQNELMTHDKKQSQKTKTQLADARGLHSDLMFSCDARSFLSWSEPLSEHQVKMLEPIIKLNHEHGLPGSAVFELIAGQQGSISHAKAALTKAGIQGVYTDSHTISWHPGTELVLKTVADDMPRAGVKTSDQQLQNTTRMAAGMKS